jgi:hypothetical protein
MGTKRVTRAPRRHPAGARKPAEHIPSPAEHAERLDNAVSSLVVLKSRLSVCLAAMQAGNDAVSPEDIASLLDDLIANRLVSVIEGLNELKQETTVVQGARP